MNLACSTKQCLHTRPAATKLTCLGCCRLQEALADFEQALTIEPKNALSHNARGLLLEKMGKPDAALADFEAAVQLEGGTNVDFLRNRGLCFRARRDYNKAVEDFDRFASPQSQDMSRGPHAGQHCLVLCIAHSWRHTCCGPPRHAVVLQDMKRLVVMQTQSLLQVAEVW